MRVLVILHAATLTVACASEPPPRPATIDPANPSAPQAPPLTISGLQTDPLPGEHNADAATSGPEHDDASRASNPDTRPSDPVSGHNDHDHQPASLARSTPSAAKAPIYTCPMHPEVRSSRPGRCPKCGMTLVPKTASGEPQ